MHFMRMFLTSRHSARCSHWCTMLSVLATPLKLFILQINKSLSLNPTEIFFQILSHLISLGHLTSVFTHLESFSFLVFQAPIGARYLLFLPSDALAPGGCVAGNLLTGSWISGFQLGSANGNPGRQLERGRRMRLYLPH